MRQASPNFPAEIHTGFTLSAGSGSRRGAAACLRRVWVQVDAATLKATHGFMDIKRVGPGWQEVEAGRESQEPPIPPRLGDFVLRLNAPLTGFSKPCMETSRHIMEVALSCSQGPGACQVLVLTSRGHSLTHSCTPGQPPLWCALHELLCPLL